LTLPTRMITGQQIISSEGQGASSALSWGTSAGCSPSHTGHVSGFKTTGIRLCSSAHNSFGVVVVMEGGGSGSLAGSSSDLDQVKNDLLNGGHHVVGGPPQVRELAWEWVRTPTADRRWSGGCACGLHGMTPTPSAAHSGSISRSSSRGPFLGEELHSHHYRTAGPFEAKSVPFAVAKSGRCWWMQVRFATAAPGGEAGFGTPIDRQDDLPAARSGKSGNSSAAKRGPITLPAHGTRHAPTSCPMAQRGRQSRLPTLGSGECRLKASGALMLWGDRLCPS